MKGKSKQAGKYLNFNAQEVFVIGLILCQTDKNYLVDFTHDGVKFRGVWAKADCLTYA